MFLKKKIWREKSCVFDDFIFLYTYEKFVYLKIY